MKPLLLLPLNLLTAHPPLTAGIFGQPHLWSPRLDLELCSWGLDGRVRGSPCGGSGPGAEVSLRALSCLFCAHSLPHTLPAAERGDRGCPRAETQRPAAVPVEADVNQEDKKLLLGQSSVHSPQPGAEALESSPLTELGPQGWVGRKHAGQILSCANEPLWGALG